VIKFFLLSGLLLFCYCLQGSQLQAQAVTFLGETEFGRKSTSEETEAQEDEVSVSRYSTEVDFRANEKFSVETKAAYWEKDYRSLNELDNITRVYGLSPSLLLFRKESHALRVRLRVNRREKRYLEQPSLSFNQHTFQPTLLLEKRKDYSLSLGLGWNDYHYLADVGKDQTIFYQETNVKKTLLEERLDLKSSYRIEMNNFERAGKEKIKHEVSAGGSYQFYQPWLESIQLSGSFGKRDSKEMEGRDEDVDFSFWEYSLKSQHAVSANLMGTLHTSNFENDFRTNRFDSNGWESGTDLDYLLIKTDMEKLRLEFEGNYKTVKYPVDSNSSYQRMTLKVGSFYQRKKDWKAALGYEANLYHFNLSSNDKARHLLFTEGGHWFMEEKLYLSLLLDYQLTHRSVGGDDSTASLTASFRYHF